MAVSVDNSGYLHKVKFTLLSTTAGSDSEVTTEQFNDMLMRVIITPDGGGTAPSAAWDVTVTDSDGGDVLAGLGANLSETAVTYKSSNDGLGCVKSSALTCSATNMGEGKGATVTLFMLQLDQ
jgi:hypothetical protein